MTLLRTLLGWMLSPRRLLALAGLSAAGGLLWAYAAVHENADRKLALRQGPPPAVAVEDYRGTLHRGPAGEVVLRASADLADRLVLTVPRSGERAVAIPLYPLRGGESALGAILIPLAPGDIPEDPGLLAALLPDGTVEVNGRVVDAGRFELILAGALAVEGGAIGERFVAVRPYLNGREAALQPAQAPARHWLWPLAAALGLAILAACGKCRDRIRPAPVTASGPAERGAPARPAAPSSAKAAHFAPLKPQEDVTGAEPPAPSAAATALALLARAIALAVRALRLLARGAAASVRFLREGVGELRSPR